MTPLTLDLLPSPPAEKTGWPWTEDSTCTFTEVTLSDWPKISIITPNYNRAFFFEKTIRSVLLQNYPNLEYIIIDGASTDDSVEIVKRYGEHITYWVSEPDGGQPNALNKGLAQCTGDIIAFINSDDYYLPGTLRRVAQLLVENPQYDWLNGICRYHDLDDNLLWTRLLTPPSDDRSDWIDSWSTYQPACFWTSKCFEKAGGFREDLEYVFDTEFTIRLLFHELFPLIVPEVFSVRVMHEDTKTLSQPAIFSKESQIYYREFATQLVGKEQETFFWRQLRRDYGKRLSERGRLPAYLYVLGRAAYHPIWFLNGWRQRQLGAN